MMSSAVNPANGDNSTMPGGYESWPAPGARSGLLGGPLPPGSQPMIPPTRTSFPRLPPTTPTTGYPGRTPFPRLPPTALTTGYPGRTPFPGLRPTGGLPMRSPHMVPRIRAARPRRHRRRPLTPEIVIDRRHRSHSSWGRRRVVTVPFDHRPTLGLRGPPRHCVEIERVRCHRHRRPRSRCYEYEYDDPPSVQPPIMIANPSLPANAQLSMIAPTNNTSVSVAPPLIVPTNNTATATFLSNLTQEMVDNLPRHTVHLPPIHLPGSQADANTELHTVIFPAEIINPVDGTLSIIQAHPTANHGVAANMQPIVNAPTAQPQLIQMPMTAGIPVIPRGPPVSPAMAADPLMQRFQQLFQRLSIPQTQPVAPTPNPSMVRPTLPTASQFNSTNNTVPIPSLNTTNVGGYSSANTQSTNPQHSSSYRPASVAPTIPGNLPTYRPPSISSSGPFNNMSYRPANITGYRPSSFTPSARANNVTYRPTSIAPSDSSDIGPYQPANITPYTSMNNRSSNNLLTQPSAPTPYAAASSAPTSSFTSFPRLYPSSSNTENSPLNPSSALPLTPNQSINSMPKSILRNTSSTAPSNTIYTNLNSPSVAFQ